MTSQFVNRVKFQASTSGVANFGIGAAVTGFRTPAGASVPDSAPVSYTSELRDPVTFQVLQWETGHGVYHSGANTISRDTPFEGSSGPPVNFSSAPVVWLDVLAQDFGQMIGVVNVKDSPYNAVGDGTTDDTVALQTAINAAFNNTIKASQADAVGQSMLFLPGGNYRITSPLSIINGFGIKITGDGKFSSRIFNVNPLAPGIFVTQGCEYSTFSDFSMEGIGGGTEVLFDLDWTGVGTSLQNNTFLNVFFGGGGIGTRIGNSGLMGSENSFFNCKWSGPSIAGLKTCNFNALNNEIFGGIFQGSPVGIWVAQGGVPTVNGVAFENGANTADIKIDNSANDQVSISGCRSESDNFVHAQNQAGVISGCSHAGANLGAFLFARTGAWVLNGNVSINGQLDAPNGGAVVVGCAWGRDDWIANNGTFVSELFNQIGRTYQNSGTGTVKVHYFGKSGGGTAAGLYFISNEEGYGVSLPYAATIHTELANNGTGVVFYTTLTGNTTFANPTINGVDLITLGNSDLIGTVVRWYITQDGLGGHTASYGGQFDFGTGSGTLSATPGVTNILRAEWDGTKWLSTIGVGGGAGGGTPATPQYANQFNNPLGTFAGDSQQVWFPNSVLGQPGLLLLNSFDAQVTPPIPGSFTPGLLNYGHAALGGYSAIDVYGFAPGDPLNEFHGANPAALQISEAFLSAGIAVAGITNYVSLKGSGISPSTLTGIDNEPVIRSDDVSTANLIGQFNGPIAYGSGVLNTFSGLINNPQQFGNNVTQNTITGTLNRIDLFPTGASVISAAIVTDNVLAAANTATIDTATMFNINFPAGGQYVSLFGLYINQMARSGGTAQCYNIYSADPGYLGGLPSSTAGGNLFQGHSAMGNYADVDTITVSPGDTGGNSGTFAAPALLIASEFLSRDFSGITGSGAWIETSFKHTGVGNPGALRALNANSSIVTQNNKSIGFAGGIFGGVTNYGTGLLGTLTGLESTASHNPSGAGDCGLIEGIFIEAQAQISGAGVFTGNIIGANIITLNHGGLAANIIGIQTEIKLESGGTNTNAYGFLLTTQPGASPTNVFGLYLSTNPGATNNYGLVVEDWSFANTAAPGDAINIWSKGVSSINKFEGTTTTGNGTVANLATRFPAPTIGMRYMVTDATQTLTAGIGAVVAGTGANKVPVFYDGTNWRIG